MRPKLKTILTPIFDNKGIVQVGFDSFAWEIEDPDGSVKRLLDLLDGSRSLQEVADEMNLSISDIEEAIQVFDEAGLLEDAEAEPEGFTELELQRYRANLNYFSNFATLDTSRYVFQKRLKEAKVAVLGLGGGSIAAANLAGMGIGHIVGLDFDRVERSNLNRQFLYTEDDLGMLKAEVAEQRLRKINPDIKIETYNRKIEKTGDLLDAIEGCDMVICLIDTPVITSLRWVNAACEKLSIPFVHGGVGQRHIMWRRFDFQKNGCYDCWLIQSLRDQNSALHLKTLYNLSFADRNTGFAPYVAMLTAFCTSEVVHYLGGYAEPMESSVTMRLDTVTMELTRSEPVPKIPECPTCGNPNRDLEPVGLEELIEIANRLK